MRVFTSGPNENHRPPYEFSGGRVERAWEIPDRVTALLDGIAGDSRLTIEQATLAKLDCLHEIHDPDSLAFLKETCEYLKDEALFPSVFPYRSDSTRRPNRRQPGEYCFDTHTPLLAGTFEAACRMACAALQAAEAIARGEQFAYALGRPPGHHAERAKYGGYSYLNGTALAANTLAKLGPVAILDVDVHHGNGTQHIFYERTDVRTASIHGDPTNLFPYFSGYAEESGTGRGLDCNRNFPLQPGTGDREYQPVLEAALEWLSKARPAFLVVALGFDTHELDPIGGFKLTTKYFTRMAATIRQLNVPTVLVQEGGYSLQHLGECAAAFLQPLTSTAKAALLTNPRTLRTAELEQPRRGTK